MASIINQPKVVFNIVGANTATPNAGQRILIPSQKLPAGSAAENTLIEVTDTSESTLDALVGSKSLVAGIIRSIRNLNNVTPIDIFLADATAGTASVGDFTLNGTVGAGNSGSLFLTIGSEIDYTFEIPVAVGDTATVIGAAITAAVALNLQIPVVVSDATGTVTVTASNPGVMGDQIGLQIDVSALSDITVSSPINAMGDTTPGAGTPDFDAAGLETAISNVRYQTVVWAYSDTLTNLSVISDIMDARFNVDNKLVDGVAISTFSDPLIATFTTTATGLSAGKNSQSLVLFADKTEVINVTTPVAASKPAQFEMGWIKSAQVSAIRALRLTPGQNISQFVTAANGPLDTIGGPALASKPYSNTPMPDLPTVPLALGWTSTEIESLLTSGASVIGVNSSGTTALLGEVATTYKTDAAGNADVSFKFLNYVDTSSNVREYFFNNNKSRFSQSRLTEGDVIRGRDMANAETITAYQAQLYQDLSGEGFVLLQAGNTALTFFKDSIVISLDLTTGTATMQITVPLVTQLREILATMQIAFTTEG